MVAWDNAVFYFIHRNLKNGIFDAIMPLLTDLVIVEIIAALVVVIIFMRDRRMRIFGYS
jgi:hypothetical protein